MSAVGSRLWAVVAVLLAIVAGAVGWFVLAPSTPPLPQPSARVVEVPDFAADRAKAETLLADGRKAESLNLFRKLLEEQRRVYGDDHPDTVRTLGDVAAIVARIGRREEALALAREAVETNERVHGPDDARTARAAFALGRELSRQRRYDESEAHYRRAAEIYRGIGVPHQLELGLALTNHGRCLKRLGRLDEAEAALLEARRGFEALGLPPTDPHIGTVDGTIEALRRERAGEPGAG